MKELWQAYDANKQAGKLPVVECAGTTKIKSDKGDSHIPNLNIVKWIDAPQELLDAVLGVEEVAALPSSAAASQHDGAGDSDEEDEF